MQVIGAYIYTGMHHGHEGNAATSALLLMINLHRPHLNHLPFNGTILPALVRLRMFVTIQF